MRAQPRMLAQMALPSHSGKLSADLYADYRVQLPRTSDEVQHRGTQPRLAQAGCGRLQSENSSKPSLPRV